MSKAQEERISLFINWGVKIIVSIASFLLVLVFVEMRNDIRQSSSDISSIKERIAKIEGMINK